MRYDCFPLKGNRMPKLKGLGGSRQTELQTIDRNNDDDEDNDEEPRERPARLAPL